MSEHEDPPSEENSGEGDGRIVERITPDEAFKLLGNETRLTVLRVLFEADDPMAFSEIYDEVDVGDSAQFNYHLDKLVGPFVERGEDGYELTTAAVHIVGAILAGRYTKTLEAPPVDVDTPCPACGQALHATFDRGYVPVSCESCDRQIIDLPVPAGAFEDYPYEEWPYVAERWTKSQVQFASAGFCPFCHGPMTSRVETDFDAVDAVDALPDSFVAVEVFTCERCGDCLYSNVESSVVTAPEVVAFHLDHGIDVFETPVWDLEWAIQPRATVRSESPLRVEVPIDVGSDRLRVVVDEHGDVVDTSTDPQDNA